MSRNLATKFDFNQSANAPGIMGTPSRICGLPNHDLCIVDSQRHCLWVIDRTGKVKFQIGSGKAGLVDGHIRDAEFNSPQSIAVFHDALYVADTKNNVIREVSLSKASVKTVQKSFTSPVDIYEFQDKLFVLESGSNKIYSLDIARNLLASTVVEGCKQPSGLTTNGEFLFFSDLSTSCIHEWDGKNLQTLYTPKNPSELNKPMSLSYSGNKLYIADTYNHQIKVLSLSSKKLEPLIGTGKPGKNLNSLLETELNYPTSVFLSGTTLYICDRGNNQIKIADLLHSKVQNLTVKP